MKTGETAFPLAKIREPLENRLTLSYVPIECMSGNVRGSASNWIGRLRHLTNLRIVVTLSAGLETFVDGIQDE